MQMTIKKYAEKCRVTPAVVQRWMAEKRIRFERPATGVVLIDGDQKRPKALKPWQRTHEGNDFCISK